LANREGAQSAINTADADMLQTGIFMNVIYTNKNFVAERR